MHSAHLILLYSARLAGPLKISVLRACIPVEIMASGPRLPYAVPDEHMADGNGQTILLIIFALCPSCVRHMQRSYIITGIYGKLGYIAYSSFDVGHHDEVVDLCRNSCQVTNQLEASPAVSNW